MNLLKPKYLKYVVLGLISALVATFWPRKEKSQGHPRDYAEIEESGIPHAATEYNSTNFYVDGDTVSGFHHELIEAFARDEGLQVQVSPAMGFNQRLGGLANGTYDVVAYGIPITSELKDPLLLTSPIILSKQVLVRRKAGENDSLVIRSQLDLAGKTLNVVKGSPSIPGIHSLSNEIGDTIYINEVEKYGSEQLIAMVAYGDIDFAVCDESIAQIAVDSLSRLDINTAVSFTQSYSWGVSKHSPVLLGSLDTWLSDFRKEGECQTIYRKYYGKQQQSPPLLSNSSKDYDYQLHNW